MKTRYTLRAVRADAGGRATTQAEIGLGPADDLPAYRRRADAWQQDFDADADPVRVYVVDADGVAVYAAGALVRHRRAAEPRRRRHEFKTAASSGGI